MQEVKALPKGNLSDGRIDQIYTKLAAHPLLLAFLLNLAAFLFRIIVFDIKYEVSDDYITDAVLSGAYGTGYDPQLLFGNIILGHFLVFIYKLIPAISFYFVLLILLGFISCTVVLYLLFKKKINTITICMAIVFLAFATDDLYVLVQFTKVSMAAGIAGGLLILHGLWEAKQHKVLFVVFGTLLLLVGSMVRFDTYLIYCAFLVIAFLYNVILRFSKIDENEKTKVSEKDVVGVVSRFSICVIIIGLLFGLMYLGQFIKNQNESYHEFNTYNILRYNITDKTRPDFEQIEEAYNNLGLDYLDYVMLNSWNFDDRDVYSDELLQNIADIQQKAVSANPPSLGDAIGMIIARGIINYPVAFTLYIPALLALALNKKKLYSLILVIVTFAMFIGLIYYGRIVYRVEWGVYFCAASCLLAGFDFDENSKLAMLKKKVFGKEKCTIAIYTVVLLALLLITRIPRTLTGITLLNCSYEDYKNIFDKTMYYSGEFLTDKIGFPTSTRKPSQDIIEYMENDPDHYYIVDFGTGIQDLYFNYDPWIRPEQGLFSEHYAYFGGCTMRHPGEVHALESNGCDPYNPFKNLTNENILLVDNWGYECKLDYFRRYYCPDAEMELIDVIDGYSIWNFYIPNN